MHNASNPVTTQALYLSKVLAGLLAVALVALSALWLPLLDASPTQRQVTIVVLAVLALALIPSVFWVYHRRDELQRLQHQQASVSTVAVLASVSALVGILQANQWVPLFNQFWTLGLLLALWAVQLMWADRRFR